MSGKQWVEFTFDIKTSSLGGKVADVLDKTFSGIYHLDRLHKVDWSNDFFITYNYYGSLATWDNNLLTRLIVLSDEAMLRLEISARAYQYLELMFHERKSREGSVNERLPSLETQIEMIKKH